MRERPFIVAVACSFAAALTLVMIEGAHLSPPGFGRAAVAPSTQHQSGAVPESGQGGAGQQGSAIEPAAGTQSMDQEPDQSATNGDASQSQSGLGGTDPNSVVDALPLPIKPGL